ncbi:hypothetical protein A2U01_0103835, partial [Trifolium medium]|nr:hypothetical protein [Trifolium medium]
EHSVLRVFRQMAPAAVLGGHQMSPGEVVANCRQLMADFLLLGR